LTRVEEKTPGNVLTHAEIPSYTTRQELLDRKRRQKKKERKKKVLMKKEKERKNVETLLVETIVCVRHDCVGRRQPLPPPRACVQSENERDLMMGRETQEWKEA
jgi:hypothetical protein